MMRVVAGLMRSGTGGGRIEVATLGYKRWASPRPVTVFGKQRGAIGHCGRLPTLKANP